MNPEDYADSLSENLIHSIRDRLLNLTGKGSTTELKR